MKTYIIVLQLKGGNMKYSEVVNGTFNQAVKIANTLKRIKFKNEFYIKSITEA